MDRKALLRRVVIETTRRCNLKCIHCKVSPENNEGNYQAIEMPLEVFERLVPMLRAYHPQVQLSGHGETLLHRSFMYMLEQAVSAGCQVTFQTNGMLLTPRKIEEIIRLGVTSITFSLDAASAELYEKIRRGANFEKVVGNIGAVAEIRDRLKRPVLLGMEFVVMRMNMHELPDLVLLAARLGVAHIQVAHLDEYNLTRGQAVTRDPSILPWIESAEKEAKAHGVSLGLPSNLPRQEGIPVKGLQSGGAADGLPPHLRGAPAGLRKACTEPWDSLLVRANGEVLPCCIIHEPYGDLARQSFEEIWSSATYRKLRSALLSDKPFEQCKSCTFYGWEPVPPRLSVSPFTKIWNDMVRRLRAAPAETLSISDSQLLWLLWKLDAPDRLAVFNRIRQGETSIAQSCLQLLHAGRELPPEEFVTRLYKRILGRDPDLRGFEGHLQSLRNNTCSPVDLIGIFLTSEEFLQKLPLH
jgi:radical SAM protein with 4Fe4S-binding SPASM domain